MDSSKHIKAVVAYFGVFLVVCGISYFIFGKTLPLKMNVITDNTTSSTSAKPTVKAGKFDGPKTEVCPINGELFTKAEKEIWSTRRPLTVMIENHEESRPQSGLQNADIVYEAVAEGGITRFMGVFYCNAAKGSESRYDLGPVRSARTYFLDVASEYADYPLYAHVGGANCGGAEEPGGGRGACNTAKKAQALEQIADYGWNSKGTNGDLSQFSLSYKVCRREPERTGEERATEHTMYCSSNELWNLAATRGLTNMTVINNKSWDKSYVTWKFKQANQASSSITASNFSFDFWSGYKAYNVSWKYDATNNKYLRSNGGKPHTDFNTNSQIDSKNIVVQYVKEQRSVDIHLHNLYEMIGTGKGVIFQNGTKTDITWTKKDRLSRTIYKTADGQEVNFVPGRVWVEILPIGNEITYENS
jgi:hypothetical protein